MVLMESMVVNDVEPGCMIDDQFGRAYRICLGVVNESDHKKIFWLVASKIVRYVYHYDDDNGTIGLYVVCKS